MRRRDKGWTFILCVKLSIFVDFVMMLLWFSGEKLFLLIQVKFAKSVWWMYNLMTLQIHRGKGWKIFDVGVQVLVVGGLQEWPLWEEARVYPVLDTDGSRQLQLSPIDRKQNTVEPLSQVCDISGKMYLRKGTVLWRVRQKNARNDPANTKVREARGWGGAPGNGAEILLQFMEGTMPEQMSTLQPMEDLMPEEVDIFWQELWPVETCFSPVMQILAGLYHTWKSLFLHQL